MTAAHGDTSDEVLMVRYQRGDREAFAELLRRYERPIYNFALRYLRHASLAEDVTQDAFLRIVQRAGEFKHESRFSTWLYTITRNLCVDQLRRQKHRRHASLDQSEDGEGTTTGERLADPKPASSTERVAVAHEIRQQVFLAIEDLPEEQREVFLLRHLGDVPFQEIAVITGVGENTVKSRMRYALERLQKALSQFEEYARALR
jgi:RNA polymerase sigma-70 factor (ECF subfamily)